MKRTKGPKCKCGCGNPVNMGKNGWCKFLKGHNLTIPLPKEKEEKRRQAISRTMKIFLKDNEKETQRRKELWLGRKHSKESKEKMSEQAKIREQKKKEQGYKISEETREKIAQALKGHTTSEKTKQKISEANKGKIRPKELREHLSTKTKEWHKENPNPFLGRKHTEESKQKISKALKGKYRGKKASNWQGGKSSIPYGPEWTPWLKEEIKKRDLNCCKVCGKDKETIEKKYHWWLEVHHIDFNKNNNTLSNLITLCTSCHGKANRKTIKQSTLEELIRN